MKQSKSLHKTLTLYSFFEIQVESITWHDQIVGVTSGCGAIRILLIYLRSLLAHERWTYTLAELTTVRHKLRLVVELCLRGICMLLVYTRWILSLLLLGKTVHVVVAIGACLVHVVWRRAHLVRKLANLWIGLWFTVTMGK